MTQETLNKLLCQNTPMDKHPMAFTVHFESGHLYRWYMTGPKSLHLAYDPPIFLPKPNRDVMSIIKS